jgi:hypothetical protein
MSPAKVNIVFDYVNPIMAFPLLTDHAGTLPAFEHASLDVPTGVKGDCAVSAHGILTEELVLNVTSCLRE